VTTTVRAGALWIPLDQPAGRLVPLLLDPRSNSSVFQEPAYAPLVRVGEDFFIARVSGSPAVAAAPTVAPGPAVAPRAEEVSAKSARDGAPIPRRRLRFVVD
jgi:hypothetical protein